LWRFVHELRELASEHLASAVVCSFLGVAGMLRGIRRAAENGARLRAGEAAKGPEALVDAS
jgi:hypothetical protein